MVQKTTGSGTVNLRYDPLGRLYEVTDASGNIRRLYYDGTRLVDEYDGSGNLLHSYVHGAGAGDDPLIAFDTSTETYSNAHHLYADRLGSVILETDDTGAKLALNAYDAYGVPGASNAGRFQYTGQAWVPEIGLYYYKARMYSPTLGRFMQTDPTGYASGMNDYAYVMNDPMNFVDPTGLDGCKRTDPPPSPQSDGTGNEIIICANRPNQTQDQSYKQQYEQDHQNQQYQDQSNNSSTFGNSNYQGGTGSTSSQTCPGAGNVKPAPKAPFDPNQKISNWVQGVPAGSQSVTAPDGTTFNAPGYADFAAAYKYGQSLSSIPFGLDTFGLQVAIGHGGMYDFQRSGGQSFTGAYTYASNYAVGVVLAGAGYSLNQALKIAGGFASTMSSNAGSPAQRSAWTNGWNAAHSGSCNR